MSADPEPDDGHAAGFRTDVYLQLQEHPAEFRIWVEEVELDLWLAAVRLVESDLD